MRIPLLCKFCMKNWDTLPVHLKRVCMKNSTPVEIAEVVSEARQGMVDHLWNGRIYRYHNLSVMYDEDNLKKVVNMLESTGCFIIGKPVIPEPR